MLKSIIKEYEGIATEHLIFGNNQIYLEVFVPEFMPNFVGTLPEEPCITKTSVKNNQNVNEPLNIDTRNTVECRYLGILSNQDIPNVHIGEKVRVISYGETTDFYWYLHDDDQHLRTVEHATWKVANKPNQEDPFAKKTSYQISMDTRPGQRKISINTSKGTGETFAYDIEIDTDNGTIDIKDDRGNGIYMESGFAPGDYLSSSELNEIDKKSNEIVNTLSKAKNNPTNADRLSKEITQAGGNEAYVLQEAIKEVERFKQAGVTLDLNEAIRDFSNDLFLPLVPAKPVPKRPPKFKYYNNWESFLEIIGDVATLSTEKDININAKEKITLNTKAYELNAEDTIRTETKVRENIASISSSLVAPLISNVGNFVSTSDLSVGNTGMVITSNVTIVGVVNFDAITTFQARADFLNGVTGDNV